MSVKDGLFKELGVKFVAHLETRFFLSGGRAPNLSIAQKGVRAIDARNSWLENGSNAAKTSVRAPRLSTDEREHPFV